MDNPWDMSVEDLRKLMAIRNPQEKLELLETIGGVEGLAEALGSDARTGLAGDEEEVAIRKALYGANVFPEPPRSTIWENWLEAIQDTTLLILIAAAFVSLFFGIVMPPAGEEATSWIEGAAILVAVLTVSIVTATLDYLQESKFREMNQAEGRKLVSVVRDGRTSEVLIEEVVVGDVVVLNTGDQVPGDGVLISGDELTADESTMTGESDSAKKRPGTVSGFMLCGCNTDAGIGTMLVTAVGEDSEWGTILKEANFPREPTPLQESLDKMAKNIGWGGLGVAIAVFVVLMVYWVADVAQKPWVWAHLHAVIEALVVAVTIVVVAVPEGLPLAVTISLAYSMKQMWADQNLVRHLRACETMGGATDICSDKTGTLTENRMTVTRGWICGQEFDDVPLPFQLPPAVADLLYHHIATNTTANITVHPDGSVQYAQNKTECALLLFAHRMGVDYRALRDQLPRVKLHAFSSARKMMSVVLRDPDGRYRLYCKGAPEFLLRNCVSIMDPDGTSRPLETTDRAALLDHQKQLACQGLRTLGLATRVLTDYDPASSDPAPECMLTFYCLMGIEDPIRPQVPPAVAQCRSAGVTVRMVTGDALETGRKIAELAGILEPDGICIEGPDFARLPLTELDRILPKLQVLARCSPRDKLKLVLRLRDHKEIVAVTGDGTNDGPALKQANVGLSMGIAGTDIARKSSDIVILDDNFASVVRALSWGRCIFDNIRKFLQFQLTVNLAALIVAFIGALTQRGAPMRAIQLLWVNLIMDTLAALALGTERPTPDLLERPPINIQKAWLISNIMIKNIVAQASYQVAILCFILYLGPYAWATTDGSLHHYTLIFNSFVWATVWNEINSRKVNGEQNVFAGLLTNWIFLLVIAFTVGAQILIVTVGGRAFKTASLSPLEWLETMLIGFGSIPVGALVRLMPIPEFDGFGFGSKNQFSLPEDRHYDASRIKESLFSRPENASLLVPKDLDSLLPPIAAEADGGDDDDSDGDLHHASSSAVAAIPSSSSSSSSPHPELDRDSLPLIVRQSIELSDEEDN